MYNKNFCKDIENVENYEKAKADDFKGWHLHHRRGIDIPRKELITLGQYYDVSADELIFVTKALHNTLHKKGNTYFRGKHHSEESKKKISENHKDINGENNPMYGKHHTAESIQKMSYAKKGNTWSRGKHWYNNGKINKFCYECPDGFVPGRLL